MTIVTELDAPIDSKCWSFQTALRTLWQEARGEPLDGQVAVSHVLVNRLRDGRWGKTFGEVCLSPLQFSGWNAHDPNRMEAAALKDYSQALVGLTPILLGAINGYDLTNGAMWYFAKSMKVPPDWTKGATPCGTFGNQMFYKGVK